MIAVSAQTCFSRPEQAAVHSLSKDKNHIHDGRDTDMPSSQRDFN